MGRFWFGRRSAHVDSPFAVVWAAGRPSIYEFLRQFEVQEDAHLPAGALQLPDEAVVNGRHGGDLRWAPGALDGVMGRYGGRGEDSEVERLAQLLTTTVRSGSRREARRFYQSIADDSALRLVDPLKSRIAERGEIDPDRLRAFATWLVTASPDREAVKVGIALLGLVSPVDATEILLQLGVHDEFTLYVAVALGTLPDAEAEEARWWLARRVDGWGRIHVVERLTGTGRADIRRWMLREGFRNSIMVEYLAYTCAVVGGLVDELREVDIDDALLDGAGELLSALILGGPAEDMSDYADGAEASQRYLQHVGRRKPRQVADFLVVTRIRDYAAEAIEAVGGKEATGCVWSDECRAEILESADVILANPRWIALVTAGLKSDDNQAFWFAARAADNMGIDAWLNRFDRCRSGHTEHVYDLMRTEDPRRIKQVVEWATTSLDLDSISTGPAEELGLGSEFSEHITLGVIVQDLRRFPGIGWRLVETALRSPVISNRNTAITALHDWPISQWPPQAHSALIVAHHREPDTNVKQRLEDLL